MTQAELSRHVRALVTSLQKSGLTVTGAKVTFQQGTPVIETGALNHSAISPRGKQTEKSFRGRVVYGRSRRQAIPPPLNLGAALLEEMRVAKVE